MKTSKLLLLFIILTLCITSFAQNNVKIGETILNRFIEDLADISTVEKKPFLEGKTMFVILTKKI